MSELKIRKIAFEFEDVDFVWNRDNPHFAVSMNIISFYAPALERYMVKATLQAERFIQDPRVKTIARSFRHQEGQHARSHQLHLADLLNQYPGLQHTVDALNAMMDELLLGESLEFHLGFMATLEGAFTPLFKMMIDNRSMLFAAGDSRVASLLLWHFNEEVEHRSAAVEIYKDVIGKHWRRIRIIPKLYRFHVNMVNTVLQGFKQHIPDLPEDYLNIGKGYRCVPKLAMAAMLWRLLLGLSPRYDHEKQPLPDWSLEWFEHYERGEDMRNFYGRKFTANKPHA